MLIGLQDAIEDGLDDDSDIYYEAGNLLEELQVGTGDVGDVDDIDTENNVMNSFQHSLYVE